MFLGTSALRPIRTYRFFERAQGGGPQKQKLSWAFEIRSPGDRTYIFLKGNSLERVSFGVGCFMFEYRGSDLATIDNRSGSYRTPDWANDVRKALEALPSVDNIHIDTPRGVKGSMRQGSVLEFPSDLQSSSSKIHEGGPFSPNPSDGGVSFRVSIPQHVQERLSLGRRACKSTVFDVDIRFEGEYPVTFVSMDTDERNPSTAVMIVREFLMDEFEQRKKLVTPISFACMGPSPFWVDCWVEVEHRGEPNQELSIDHTHQAGYDDFVFTGSAASLAEQFAHVKDAVVHELGQYYALVAERNLMSKQDLWINLQLEDLLELQQSRGFRAWATRLWSAGNRSLSLSLQILYAENRESEIHRHFIDALEASYALYPVKVFHPWIDEEVKKMDADGRSKIREMASLLAINNSRRAEIVALATASLGGGIAGATLTAIVSGMAGAN